jgi:antimicrobial peptide system SdpA family protein
MNIQVTRRIVAIRAVLVSIWAVAIFFVLSGVVPASPVSPSFKRRLALLAITPEGWGFFTRDPRELGLYLYRATSRPNGDLQLSPGKLTRSADWLGIGRYSRVQGIELASLVKQISATSWTACQEGLQNCPQLLRTNATQVVNKMNVQSLCGEYVIEQKKPVPWAWARGAKSVVMPSQATRIQVGCQ